jgi:hypothetical protein
VKKPKKKYYIFNLVSIMVIIILLFTCLLKHIHLDLKLQTVEASSVWSQNTNSDFINGTSENISITQNDEIKLDLDTKYIEDDFIDESKISYKQNIIVDTPRGEARLSKIFNVFGGSEREWFSSGQQTSDDGYILVGSTYSYGAGESDIWLIKTDKFGIKQWDRTFGGSNPDGGACVQQTTDDGFIITGIKDDGYVWLIKTDCTGIMQWNKTFYKNKINKGVSVQQTSDNGYILLGNTDTYTPNNSDLWLIKTDEFGNVQWNKTFGGSDDEYGYSVNQTFDGGYVIIGVCNIYNIAVGNVWLIKTNNSGIMEWSKTFGGSQRDWGYSGKQTSDGGYIITGFTRSYSKGESDLWVIKTDVSGNEIWNKSFGGEKYDTGKSIHQTTDGGYIIIGELDTNGIDIWLLKLDNFGKEQWSRTFGGTDVDRGVDGMQTSDGGYVIVGHTYSYGEGEYDALLIKTDNSGDIANEGYLISKNLLEGNNVASINVLNYSASIPPDSYIKIQFSTDNITWYDSERVIDGWNLLYNGHNTIEFTNSSWHGSSFFCKIIFISENVNIPVLKNINIIYKQYLSSGTFESQLYYSGRNVNWMTFCWKCSIPSRTYIKFQLRTADTESGLMIEEYVGPNGKPDSYYTVTENPIWSGHDNQSWIQYKVFLSTIDTSRTPILEKIIINYNHCPEFVSSFVTPNKGDINTTFNFSTDFFDYNNDPPIFVYICIDGINYSMTESDEKDRIFSNGKSYWYSTKLGTGNHSYRFFTSDGELNRFTLKKYLNVDIGSLDHILIEPSTITITTDDFQIFVAKGFDEEGNSIVIKPKWEVNGGGIINENGNFTATTPGIWTLYANLSGINKEIIITVTEGLLNHINIIPKIININISESIILTVKGYDADNNELGITPLWEVNGGGSIDINGKFTAMTPGKWQVYATLNGISSNATIIVQQKDNRKINNGDGREKGMDNLTLFLIIGVIMVVIIIALLFFFVFKKKLKKDEIKKEEKPIEELNVQQQISQLPQHQPPPQPSQYQIPQQTAEQIQEQNKGAPPI